MQLRIATRKTTAIKTEYLDIRWLRKGYTLQRLRRGVGGYKFPAHQKRITGIAKAHMQLKVP